MYVSRSRPGSRPAPAPARRVEPRPRVAIAALALVAAILVLPGCSNPTAPLAAPSSSDAPTTAAVVSRGGLDADRVALVVGTGPVRLDVYVDMMCPFCASFDAAQQESIAGWVGRGDITVAVHPLNFLDRESAGASYSTRAASALAAASAESPDDLLTYMTTLFEHQPAEGTRGLSDDQLIEMAPASSRDAVASALDARPYDTWLDHGTSTTMSGRGAIRSTPTVQIDGVAFQGDLRGTEFRDAVDASVGG